MLNRLEDLDKEDVKYGLPVNVPAPDNYNLVLVFTFWKPPPIEELQKKLKDSSEIKLKLAKLGIFR
jgi:hypothetical protein